MLILAGVGYSLLGNPFPTESPPQGTASTEQASLSEDIQPAPSFEQEIEKLQAAIADVTATGESREVTLVLTETEANNQAARLLAQVEIPEDIPLEIESVHIDFREDNNIVTEIRGVAYGFEVTIKVKAKVSIEEGKPVVEVTNASLGKNEIAVFITQAMDNLLSQLTGTETGDNGKVDLEFTDISVQESKVTITVIIRPRA